MTIFSKKKSSSAKSIERELKEQKSLVEAKDGNKIIVIFLILTISLLLSVVVNLALLYLSLHLGTREKIFVIRQNTVEIAEEKDPDFRSDKLIEETVSNWLYLSQEWDSSIPGTTANDPGIQLIGSDKQYFRIPTKTYAASYLLAIGFRNKYLEKLSESVPTSFYSGKIKSTLKIYFIGNIQRIDKNLYTVDVIMTRTDLEENVEIAETQISQTISLQATKPYQLVMGNEEPSAFRKQLKELLKSGLIIYKISPKNI